MALNRKKEFLKREVVVSSKDALKNAVKAGYGRIVIKGSFANEIAGELRKSKTGNAISGLGLIGGVLFPPLLVAGAVGAILTNDLAQYEILEVSDAEVKIQHKKAK